jgi:type IV secretion system protein VirD4
MFKQTEAAIYCGLFEGQPLFYNSDGGAIIIGGARSGKLTTILAQNICHGIGSGASNLILDMKGELAAISVDQIPTIRLMTAWKSKPAALPSASPFAVPTLKNRLKKS